MPRPSRLVDAAAGESELERLMGHALDWLARSVPATVAIYSPVGPDLNLFTRPPVVVRRQRGIELGRLEWMCREYLDDGRRLDPFAPSRWWTSDATVVGVPGAGGSQEFARSSYGEFLAGHGFAGQASLFLRRSGRIVAAIVLLRALGEPRLRAAELLLLRGTQPLLEQAHAFVSQAPLPADPAAALRRAGLTARELDVARLAADGATNAEIGRALFLGLATVKTHMARVLTKTGARSRAELALLVRAADPVL